MHVTSPDAVFVSAAISPDVYGRHSTGTNDRTNRHRVGRQIKLCSTGFVTVINSSNGFVMPAQSPPDQPSPSETASSTATTPLTPAAPTPPQPLAINIR
jgi:hypothetical protein